MEQGSYMLIAPGMTVRGADADLGTVSQVIADEDVDVFRGIVLAQGLLLPKKSFIPADHVIGVNEHTVQVDLTRADIDRLPPMTTETSQGKETKL